MKTNFKHSVNYIAALMAIANLLLGTFCLLVFKTNGDTGFVAIGYFYMLSTTALNTLMLLFLLMNAVRYFCDFKEHLFALLLLLATIPIPCWYFEIF